MIKLLIAEDEEIEVQSLIKKIDWEETGLELVGIANNANEAIPLVKKYEPHILITDIEMPGMSGIDLVSEIKLYQPDIKIIFYTGHADFKYAKAGIQFHIDEYITKPVEKAYLNKVLKRLACSSAIEKQKKLEEKVFKQQIIESKPILRDRFLKDWAIGLYNNDSIILSRLNFLEINKSNPYKFKTIKV